MFNLKPKPMMCMQVGGVGGGGYMPGHAPYGMRKFENYLPWGIQFNKPGNTIQLVKHNEQWGKSIPLLPFQALNCDR